MFGESIRQQNFSVYYGNPGYLQNGGKQAKGRGIKILIVLGDSSTARYLPNRRGRKQREVTREANLDISAADTASKNPRVDNFITELANLSIPHYLKDIYLNFSSSSGELGMKANTIRSFENTAKNADCGFYKFEVHKDKVDREQIVRAELHLLQVNSPVSSGHYRVDIYYILRAQDLESPLRISFKRVSSTPGWKTFDITQIAESWKEQGWVNHGLKMKLTKGDDVLSCDGVFADGREDGMDTEPSLVVYTNDQDSKFFEGLLKKEEKALTRPQRRKRSARGKRVSNVGCHREQLMVKRESLSGRNIQLLLPNQFDAGMCVGHCKKLEKNAAHLMSYASVISLHYLHNGGLDAAPSRCCVPISYNSVIMFFQHTHQTILKKLPAQVRECGCL